MYGVTGASGKLGRLVVSSLLANGTAPSQIVAIVRNSERAADLASSGVVVRTGDYDEPASLPAALAGVDVLLLISGSVLGNRVQQHSAVIGAAAVVGVTRVVYTSILRADTTENVLAPEHKATEALLTASGLAYSILRNSWYTEVFTDSLPQYLAQGAINHATGNQPVAAASRADFAAAAATVMTGVGHDNRIYELGGNRFTMLDLADVISKVTGHSLSSNALSADRYRAVLLSRGLDEDTANFVVALDESQARGELDTEPDLLIELVGRDLASLDDIVRGSWRSTSDRR